MPSIGQRFDSTPHADEFGMLADGHLLGELRRQPQVERVAQQFSQIRAGLGKQDRSRWNHALIREGVTLVTAALRRHRTGPYQLQAAVAAVHDQASNYADTNWAQIASLYGALERVAPNPLVTVNRAVAIAMVDGHDAGLEVLAMVDDRLEDHHRYHAVRAHLLELAKRPTEALAAYDDALRLVTNTRERDHLQLRRARLRSA